MNKLPDFNAAHIDSDEFRNFIRKFARPKAMEGWDREKTFMRGGQKMAAAMTIREILEKVAAEKDAQWLARGLGHIGRGIGDFFQGHGSSTLHGLAQLPLRAAERGVHSARTFGSDVAAAFNKAPSTMSHFAPSAQVDRISRGAQGGRTALSLLGGGALATTGAAAARAFGGGAKPPEVAAHAPAGAPAPTKTPPKPAAPTLDGKSDGPLPPSQRQVAPAAPQLDGKSDGPLPPSQRQIAPAQATAPAAPPAAAMPPPVASAAPGAPEARTEISQAEIAAQPGLAGNIVAYINENGKRPSREELQGWLAQRQQKNYRKRQSYYIDPKSGQRMVLDENTREWGPKMGAEKTAADAKDIMRWLLGSALIGAGARTSVSLYNRLTEKDPLSPSDQLYDPEIEIPVDMTPEQMAKYKALSAPAAKKTAAAWDNTLAALTMTGGGALGWSLAHAMIRRQKERKLDERLKKLREELTMLSQPEIRAEGLDAAALKQAAAVDFFHIAAERYQKHIKEAAGIPKVLLDLVAKAKMLPGKAKATWQGMDPMAKVLTAGGAGLAAAPLIPGVRHVTGGIGDVATGGALAGLKTLGQPIGYGAAATLGPVAALGALYALYKGYETAEKDDPQSRELKALREAIREREIEERPYFKLTPRVAQESKS